MARADHKKGTPHLFSGLVASALVAAVLFAGRLVAVHLEHSTVSSTAPELFPLKNQGLAFQCAAVHAPNVLPLYGTSELIIPSVQDRANLFFRSAPTGFQISPSWWWRREPVGHIAKSRRTRLGLAWQKTCYLAFTGLVFEGQVRMEGLTRQIFRRWQRAKRYSAPG